MLKEIFSNKGFFYITGGNLIGALLTGSFWLLLAAIQTPHDYGKINYLVSVSSLVTFVALLGLNTTITAFNSKESENLKIQANQVAMISGIIFAIIAGVTIDWQSGLFVFSMVLWMMSLYDLLSKKAYSQYAIVNIGARALQFVFSILLYYVFGVWGIMIGFILSFFIFSYPYFSSFKKFSFKFDEIKSKVKFSSHAFIFSMSTAFLLYFDKLVILPLFGYIVLGYYQLSLQFLLFIGMIPISLYQYLLSEESKNVEKRKLRMIGLLISVLLAGISFVISPIVIGELFPSFDKSADAIRIMSLGIIPMTIVWTTNSKFFNIEKSKLVAIGSGIYLSVQTGLIYLLGFEYGINGLAIALVVALSCQAAFLYICQRRINSDAQSSYIKKPGMN